MWNENSITKEIRLLPEYLFFLRFCESVTFDYIHKFASFNP